MSAGAILTQGLGGFSTASLILTQGLGAADAPVADTSVQGWASGGYFLRMSEAKFDAIKQKRIDHLAIAQKKILELSGLIDTIHAEIIDPTPTITHAQKEAKRKRLQNLMAKRFLAEQKADASMQKLNGMIEARKMADDEADDEEFLLNHLIN